MTAALPVVADAIPGVLKGQPRWLNWVLGEPRPNGKRPKVPVNPRTGRSHIDTTDPRQFGTFDQAIGRYRRGGVDGVGYSLAPPFAAGDLDHCVGPAGDLEPWAAAILAEFPTYAELSPSGTGLRLIGLGRLDPEKRNKRGSVEMYDRGRYVTVTGNRLPDAPLTVANCIEAFAWLQDRITPPPERPAVTTTPGDGFTGPDAELLERAFAAANGERVRQLWLGQTAGRTPSENLLGLARLLAYWTGPDPARLESLVTSSPLWTASEDSRPKWSSPRRGGTWGSVYVIRKAIDSCPVFYRGSVPPTSSLTSPPNCVSNCGLWTAVHMDGLRGLRTAWARVEAGELVPGFFAGGTRGRLASLCWHLAGCRTGGHFYLAERDAAELLGITKTPVRNLLRKLEAAGVIQAVRRGCQKPTGGTATEFVCLGNREEMGG